MIRRASQLRPTRWLRRLPPARAGLGPVALVLIAGCAARPAPPMSPSEASAHLLLAQAQPSDAAPRAEDAPPPPTPAPASSPPGPPAPAPLDGAAEPDHDPTLARTFGWLSIAVGTESAIVVAATSVMMLEDKSTRDAGCNSQKICSSAAFTANGQLSAVAGWNVGAWVLAAAGLGVGTYLLLSHPVEKHTTLSLSPLGASLAGTF